MVVTPDSSRTWSCAAKLQVERHRLLDTEPSTQNTYTDRTVARPSSGSNDHLDQTGCLLKYLMTVWTMI